MRANRKAELHSSHKITLKPREGQQLAKGPTAISCPSRLKARSHDLQSYMSHCTLNFLKVRAKQPVHWG